MRLIEISTNMNNLIRVLVTEVYITEISRLKKTRMLYLKSMLVIDNDIVILPSTGESVQNQCKRYALANMKRVALLSIGIVNFECKITQCDYKISCIFWNLLSLFQMHYTVNSKIIRKINIWIIICICNCTLSFKNAARKAILIYIIQ